MKWRREMWSKKWMGQVLSWHFGDKEIQCHQHRHRQKYLSLPIFLYTQTPNPRTTSQSIRENALNTSPHCASLSFFSLSNPQPTSKPSSKPPPHAHYASYIWRTLNNHARRLKYCYSFWWCVSQAPKSSCLISKPNSLNSLVIGGDKSINIFAGFTRDFAPISARFEDSALNTTILAPVNSAIMALPRKPWENKEGQGEDEERAKENLKRFVEAHVVPVSPWKEGVKIKALAGGEVWWEHKAGKKYVRVQKMERSEREWANEWI